MAGHNEIKVGSRGEWVVRKGGADVLVKVIAKNKNPTGRSYLFTIKEVRDGRVVGREFTRGSGSFRRPGQPAKGFGGKNPPPPRKRVAPRTRVAPSPARRKRAAPKIRVAPAPPPTPPAKPKHKATSSPQATSRTSSPDSGLTSLRGRGRAKPRPSAPTAPARPKKREEGIKFKPPSPLAKDVMRAIERTDGSVYQINKVVVELIARARYQASYGHLSSPARSPW